MWILTQDKESVINLDRCEYIILDDECYNEYYIGTLFKAFTPGWKRKWSSKLRILWSNK